MNKPFISIVVPVFGEGFDASLFYKELDEALSDWARFEVIFVNDSFEDENWRSIKKQEGLVDNIISFCNGENRGQHFSTKIGLEKVNGDYVVVSDCDGQDNPCEIKKMFNMLEQDCFDIVFGQRVNRKDGLVTILLSKIFYSIINIISGIKYDEKTTSFSVAKSFLVKSLLEKKHEKVIYGISIRKITKNIGYIEVCHRVRNKGKSSYSFCSKVKLALEVIILCLNSSSPEVMSGEE